MSISSLLNQSITKLTADNYRLFWALLFVISLSSLGLAYFTQYVLGYEPCILCLYERIPYALLAVISAIGFKAGKYTPSLLRLLSLILLTGLGLTIYHSGVEHGVFAPTKHCLSNIDYSALNVEQLMAQIYAMPIATCTVAPFKVFGLSMAEWNGLFTFSLLCIVVYLRAVLRKNNTTTLN